ncbi:DMT family transporter [Coralliovum pocilloporae]|uniref:DMT family transporter n=1 Tax=Coralliovum pocilloporae TaxID=3066369 RepID=UPI003306EE12
MSFTASGWRVYGLLVLMPLFFSSNVIFGRVAVTYFEPWTLAALRWGITGLVLLPLAWPWFQANRDQLKAQWPWLLFGGFLGMWICGAIVYYALRYTTATNGTLIYTASPVMILLLDWLLRGRAISVREVIGIVLGLLGVFYIVLNGEFARLLALQFNAGDLFFVLTALSWALYSLVLKRDGLQNIPTVPLFVAVCLAGFVTLAPFMAMELVYTAALPTNGTAWLLLAGIVAISSILAFLTFQIGVKVVGPSTTGIFMYLLPPYGILMAVLFLGETFETYHAIGICLVMGGVILATFPKRR